MAQRYNNPSFGRGWNEFQWEQELRRDDRRITCYFRELPLCQDLPGEEEMIFEVMQSRPGLVPAGAAPGHWRMWDAPVFDRDEDADYDAPPRRKPGDEWIERLDRLHAEWNAMAALELKGSLIEPALGVSCAIGKVIVRFTDFVDTESPELLALKICLAKRAIEDINELCGMLFAIGDLQPSVAGKTAALSDTLQHAREYLTDQLAELRRG